MKKISHSAYTKYQTCGALYKYHYVDRLRPSGTSSALIFGGAVDEALNAALLETADPIEVFRNQFTWEACQECSWFKNDYDPYILTRDECIGLLGRSKEYITWACMRKKGRIMIQSYIDKVLPLIEEVHGVQLETPKRPGFVDAVLTIRGYGMVLIDNKTTSMFYKRTSVKESTQLALYASQLEIRKIGFITLGKNIPKIKTCTKCGHDGTGARFKTCNVVSDNVRCHGVWDIRCSEVANIQILIDDVEDEDMEAINNSIVDTETAIEAKKFDKNYSACDNMFGKKCPYYDYCRSGNKQGLIKKKEGER